MPPTAPHQKTTTTFYYDRDNRRHLIGKFPTVRLERAREADGTDWRYVEELKRTQ